MKNVYKIFFTLAILFLSLFFKLDDTGFYNQNFRNIKPSDSIISSYIFNEIPCILSQINNKQEISQAKNGKNNQTNIITKVSFFDNLISPNYIFIKLITIAVNKNVYTSSVLKNIIYTRAP